MDSVHVSHIDYDGIRYLRARDIVSLLDLAERVGATIPMIREAIMRGTVFPSGQRIQVPHG